MNYFTYALTVWCALVATLTTKALADNISTNITPVEVFIYCGNTWVYICKGVVYPDAPHEYGIFLHEHAFPKGQTNIYGVRNISTNTSCFRSGYITTIVSTSKDNKGFDIVFATIGQQPREIVGFSTIPEENTISIRSTNVVTMAGKSISSLRSVSTGKDAWIIGYGSRSERDNDHSFVIVEAESAAGCSGTAFYDEKNNLLFIQQGGFTSHDPVVVSVNDFLRKTHRQAEGVAVLVGPIEIGPLFSEK